jgi:hypothetical protein
MYQIVRDVTALAALDPLHQINTITETTDIQANGTVRHVVNLRSGIVPVIVAVFFNSVFLVS